MLHKPVVLLTNEEHAIIADWLDVDPLTDNGCCPDATDALKTLGFASRASGYTESDAAVAAIVLERVQHELPQWGAVRQGANDETEVTLGREMRDRLACRTIETMPQHLLTINWADSGPGFSWPVSYYVTWLPLYNEFVVTQSADCPDAFGYCDFAIGHFPPSENLSVTSAETIQEDWEHQHNQYCQSRWAYLFSTGIIDEQTALIIREEVWDDEPA